MAGHEEMIYNPVFNNLSGEISDEFDFERFAADLDIGEIFKFS